MKCKAVIFLCILVLATCPFTYSQKKEGFKIIEFIPGTPVKNQEQTGTCWAHATTSFLESEAVRLGKEPVVISPMYFVSKTYMAKAEQYVRMEGNSVFGEGDLTFGVMAAYKNYGAVPQEIYTGLLQNESPHLNHDELSKLLLAMVKSIATSGNKVITQYSWRKAIQGTLDAYLGAPPSSFAYKGKTYTPRTFADEVIGINPNDYYEITSYSHHPFYSRFILETMANWNHGSYLNLPVKDWKEVIDNALANGYTLAWDGDVSETGFNRKTGFAELSGPYKDEPTITQEMRQITFNNYSTKDDHNMHLIGISEDKNGKRYYIIKNSWGTANELNGYVYMSENYLLLKTISVLVHKDAIPKKIREKFVGGL